MPGHVQLVPAIIVILSSKQVDKTYMCVHKRSAIGKPVVTWLRKTFATAEYFSTTCQCGVAGSMAGVQRQSHLLYPVHLNYGMLSMTFQKLDSEFPKVSLFLPI